MPMKVCSTKSKLYEYSGDAILNDFVLVAAESKEEAIRLLENAPNLLRVSSGKTHKELPILPENLQEVEGNVWRWTTDWRED